MHYSLSFLRCTVFKTIWVIFALLNYRVTELMYLNMHCSQRNFLSQWTHFCATITHAFSLFTIEIKHIYQVPSHSIAFLTIKSTLTLHPPGLQSTGKSRKHSDDTRFCRIHTDIAFKVEYQRWTPLGTGEKPCNFNFIPRLNQSNTASARAKTAPRCSSSTPTCFTDLKLTESLRRYSAASSFLQNIWFCDLDWAMVQKISYAWSKKEENYSPRMVLPWRMSGFSCIKIAFSLALAAERWAEPEWMELVRFQQHLAVMTLTHYCVYDLYTLHHFP